MMMNIREKLLEEDKVWLYSIFMVIKDLHQTMEFMKQKQLIKELVVNQEEKRKSYTTQKVMNYPQQKLIKFSLHKMLMLERMLQQMVCLMETREFMVLETKLILK